jgi:hypothetical protein
MALSAVAGLVILMIGDSHLAFPGSLSTSLQDLLIQQGATVTTYGACGVPLRAWAFSGTAPCGVGQRVQSAPQKVDRSLTAPVPTLTSLANSVHPNMLIVSLGDTLAYYTDDRLPVERLTEELSALTGQIRALNIPCIWVGPGWGSEGNQFNKTDARTRQIEQLLSTHVSPCHFIDSTTFSKPGEWTTMDGMHYTPVSYRKWGQAIDAAILQMMPLKAN